jgi:predicted acylesterase/phospholipase RssA
MDQKAITDAPKESLLSRLWRWVGPKPPDPPVSEATVLDEERKQILDALKRSTSEGGFLALALSGGGIRSATFNLGVLQGLAERGLLTRLDYLSTASGGGYIGSWLSALTMRKGGIEAVEKELDPRTAAARGGNEPDSIKWLRRFSNYLTPQTGLLSTDTLAGVATYVRNLLLTQSILVSAFTVVLVVPRLIPWVGSFSIFQSPVPAIITLFISALFINLNLAHQLVRKDQRAPFFARQNYVLWLIVLPLILAAWLIGVLLLSEPDSGAPHKIESVFLETTILAFGAVWAVAWALVELWVVGKRMGTFKERWRNSGIILVGLAVALALGVTLLYLLRQTLRENQSEALVWHWTVWGVPTLLSVFGLATVLLIGLAGRAFEEEDREWWSRLGAWLIAGSVGWLVLCAAAIYGPFAIILGQHWIESLGLAWIASTAAGVVLGKSKFTGGPDSNKWLNLATQVAPYIFVAGLLITLSFGVHVGLIALFDPEHANVDLRSAEQLSFSEPSFVHYFQVLNGILSSRPPSWTPALALFALAALLVWRLDINLFSLHMLYRNRLARCYLGASNADRRAHPFTGFDPEDNVKLTDLPLRPFHIVNTAINLTKVNNLAWQERKAGSFVFTRLYCGYSLPAGGSGEDDRNGYQRASDFLSNLNPKGWISLGQAMTISGAAASPNQGYHSSKAVAFLLTAFNVRLGWWMQNPAKPGAWGKPGPRFGLWYLLSEVFGLADEDTQYVYLSDGGHFDNLGIYELVRRQCRFIIAVDAGMDRQFGFEDLGNAVRKCQVDFGVRIDIDTRASIPDPGTGKSLYHCGVGRIHYEDADPNAVSGFLLYIKPSMTGNEPIDIMQYASVHPEFPHQSTADQWFDESQFEAYRKLGYYTATTVLEKRKDEAEQLGPAQERSLLDLFVDLSRRWYRPSARVEANFTKHAEQLGRLQNTIREEKILSFLDSQIFPEWDYLMQGGQHVSETSLWLPDKPEELRAGFYFCLNLLELMQNVYLDLNLDEEWQHPDNRGWMNLFKHFSWAGMLRATYAIVRSNVGARFQRFCAARLELPEGEIVIPTHGMERGGATGPALTAWLEQRTQDKSINFVEVGLIAEFEKAAPKGVPPGPRFDTLLPITLAVRGMHRKRGDAMSTTSALSFPVGMALAMGKTIVFFRIQDHLRNMGLGREALKALYRMGHEDLDIDEDSPDARRIRDLFASIKGRR